MNFHEHFAFKPKPAAFRTVGLWFEGKVLVDMDGHWELPKAYVKLLRTHGYILDDSWD